MNAGISVLLAVAQDSQPADAQSTTGTTQADASSTNGGTAGGDTGTSGTAQVEVVNLDPTPYETVALDSGEFRIVQQVTFGDILICFCLLLVLAVMIGKWLWEATK